MEVPDLKLCDQPATADQVRRLWDDLVTDPESELFGMDRYDALPPAVQMFARRAYRMIDPASLSPGHMVPRARIACAACLDKLVISKVDRQGNAVCWWCLECSAGIAACAGWWQAVVKGTAKGKERYEAWMRERPDEAARVLQYVKP